MVLANVRSLAREPDDLISQGLGDEEVQFRLQAIDLRCDRVEKPLLFSANGEAKHTDGGEPQFAGDSPAFLLID